MSSNLGKPASEAKRLEELWQGQFGDAYTERNRAAGEARAPFWQAIFAEFLVQRVLEVGCNLGANLQWVITHVSPHQVYGVDINLKALEEIHRNLPTLNAVWTPARELPFRDRWFDLVFTMGVLIHQPETTLPVVMAEIVRCSRRYVLCGEYFAEQTTEVPYRGQEGALFKRNYGRLYQELFPELILRKQGFLKREEGWDDVTYWLFEKP
jgi:pseudaminic acid biosynthesis-associated methylase